MKIVEVMLQEKKELKKAEELKNLDGTKEHDGNIKDP